MDRAQAEELASSILDIPEDMGRKQSTEGMYTAGVSHFFSNTPPLH